MITILTSGLEALERRLSGVSQAITIERDDLADGAALEVVKAAEVVWPSRSHPENIYARDRSVREWTVERIAPGRRNVVCLASYSGYVNLGYTRWKGEGSAAPWKARGAAPYSKQIVAEAVKGIRAVVKAWVAERIGGAGG